MLSSGLLMNPDAHWITFHGGVDFGYMLKSILGQELPPTEQEFMNLMSSVFCNYYDIKEMKKEFSHLRGGLSGIAEMLSIDRVGITH